MGATDIFIAYKFIKMLSTPWEKTDAFKLGIIDDKGNILKSRKDLKTGKEKKAYNILHTLTWNIKKMLDKLPPTKTRIGSFATALWLLKEELNRRDTILEESLARHLGVEVPSADIDVLPIEEVEYMIRTNASIIHEGVEPKDTVVINKNTNPISVVLGVPLYECLHVKTGNKVVLSNEDILRIS